MISLQSMQTLQSYFTHQKHSYNWLLSQLQNLIHYTRIATDKTLQIQKSNILSIYQSNNHNHSIIVQQIEKMKRNRYGFMVQIVQGFMMEMKRLKEAIGKYQNVVISKGSMVPLQQLTRVQSVNFIQRGSTEPKNREGIIKQLPLQPQPQFQSPQKIIILNPTSQSPSIPSLQPNRDSLSNIHRIPEIQHIKIQRSSNSKPKTASQQRQQQNFIIIEQKQTMKYKQHKKVQKQQIKEKNLIQRHSQQRVTNQINYQNTVQNHISNNKIRINRDVVGKDIIKQVYSSSKIETKPFHLITQQTFIPIPVNPDKRQPNHNRNEPFHQRISLIPKKLPPPQQMKRSQDKSQVVNQKICEDLDKKIYSQANEYLNNVISKKMRKGNSPPSRRRNTNNNVFQSPILALKQSKI